MIDEKALLSEIAKTCPECYGLVAKAVRNINEGIVRCRDCKYRNGDYCHDHEGFAHGGNFFFVHMDDFCCNGERRPDETD